MGLAEELQDETAEVLSSLIRFSTVNPPGNERECLEWLAGYLEDAGLTVELDGAEPERPNLVATLQRAATGRRSATSRHVDTVLADTQDWSADPWGAEIRDGFLYGRGTIDMKNQTAAEAVAAARLARARRAGSSGTLKVITVADEETGGVARRQVDHRGAPGPLAASTTCSTRAPARSCPTATAACTASAWPRRARSASTSRTTGTAAHASVPGLADNALLKLAPADHAARRGPPALRPDGGDARAAARRSARTRTTRSGALERVARGRAAARAAARRRDARHVRAHDRLARARRSTSSRPAPRCASTAASRRGWARTSRCSAPARCSGDDGFELEFTEAIVGNRSPGRLAADGRHPRLGRRAGRGRRGRPDRPARPSPTAAGSGPRSRTASPTASSPSATRPSTRPGR